MHTVRIDTDQLHGQRHSLTNKKIRPLRWTLFVILDYINKSDLILIWIKSTCFSSNGSWFLQNYLCKKHLIYMASVLLLVVLQRHAVLLFLLHKKTRMNCFSVEGHFFPPHYLPLLVQALSVCAPCQALAMPASWQVNERSHRSPCFFPGDVHCPHSVSVTKPNKIPRTSKMVHYGLPVGSADTLRNGIGCK